MEQIVTVRAVNPDGSVQVVLRRKSVCSGDCHQCAGCGEQAEQLLFRAENPIGAVPGDRVIVRSAPGPVLRGAAVLYGLPLVLFFLGYGLGSLWHWGAPAGGLGFALGLAGAVLYDRKVEKKRKKQYTITGFAGKTA